MRHFILLVVLFISATAFSQTTADSSSILKPIQTITIQKVDTVQIERINNIEKKLSAFYTYNRRSHTLLFTSLGMSIVGIILSKGKSNGTAAIIPLAGTVVGLVGTAIYLDSYKFLNFKPKRSEIRKMTYY